MAAIEEKGHQHSHSDPPLQPCALNVVHTQMLALGHFLPSMTTTATTTATTTSTADASAASAYGGSGSGIISDEGGQQAPHPAYLAVTSPPVVHVTIRPLQSFVESEEPTTITGAPLLSSSSSSAGEAEAPPPACFVSVEPSSLSLKRGTQSKIAVSLTPLRPGARINALLAVEVSNGLRLMVLAKCLAESKVFGIPISMLPASTFAAPDQDPDLDVGTTMPPNTSLLLQPHGQVPVALIELRRRLVRRNLTNEDKDREGLKAEGIFRVAASGDEVSALKQQVNAGLFNGNVSTCTPLAAATLIKVFFRELLPKKAFSEIPVEPLLTVNQAQECIALVEKHVNPTMQALLAWLVDLLAETAEYEPFSRMSAKALAVCVGPNLISIEVEGSSTPVNPMTALMCSQKSVHVLTRLVESRMAVRQALRQSRRASSAVVGAAGASSAAYPSSSGTGGVRPLPTPLPARSAISSVASFAAAAAAVASSSSVLSPSAAVSAVFSDFQSQASSSSSAAPPVPPSAAPVGIIAEAEEKQVASEEEGSSGDAAHSAAAASRRGTNTSVVKNSSDERWSTDFRDLSSTNTNNQSTAGSNALAPHPPPPRTHRASSVPEGKEEGEDADDAEDESKPAEVVAAPAATSGVRALPSHPPHTASSGGNGVGDGGVESGIGPASSPPL